MPFPRKHRRFLDQLVQNRFRPAQVRKLLNERRAAALAASAVVSSGPKCLTGTHGGMFYRIRVPPSHQRRSLLPLTIPKLHTPTSPPMRLTSLPPVEQSATSACAGGAGAVLAASPKKGPRYADFWDRLYRWLRENSATLVLNVGSICTLVGFTRTDVLELRRLSVAGSLCAVFYHCMLTPVRLPPILWSFTFAGVNSYKIYEILVERQGAVNLTQEQEERYIRFFMPHGVTPKQFELIQQKAKVLHIKKGTILIRQNVELNHVYLGVNGTTRASVLGRYLTAASTAPTAHDERMGDASGAWIGEMSLLERVWLQEQGKQQLRAKEGGTTVPAASSASPTTPAALTSIDLCESGIILDNNEHNRRRSSYVLATASSSNILNLWRVKKWKS